MKSVKSMMKRGLLLVLLMGIPVSLFAGESNGVVRYVGDKETTDEYVTSKYEQFCMDYTGSYIDGYPHNGKQIMVPFVYMVTGNFSEKATVTYVTPEGTFQEEVRLPWRLTVPVWASRKNFVAHVSAQSPNRNIEFTEPYCIRARIYENAQKVAESRSCISYGIATVTRAFEPLY